MEHNHRRRARASTIAAAIAIALAMPAYAYGQAAQQSDAPNAATQQADGQGSSADSADLKHPTQLQAVEVTGTHIKGSELASQVPIITITSEDLRRTGLTSVGDILQELTSSGSALNSKFNSSGNFGFPPDGGGIGAGAATLDLRNLGPKRVLILVDGIRWVNGSSASGVSSAVDLNTIPLGIIDRIDILQDGASALYGADAMAGVVNIITKRSQDGGRASVYYGGYNNLDGGDTTHADLSFGGHGNDYQFFVDFNYVKQKGIGADAWGRSSDACIPGTGVAACSSGTPTGRFIFTDPQGTTHDVTLNGPVDGTANFPGDFHQFTNDDRFNYAAENLLLTPSERKSIFAQFRYNVTDNMTWYARGLYNNRTSLNQAAPEPIFLGAGAGVGALADGTGVDVTNPYNPFGYTLDADPETGNLILIGRRPVEGGPRKYSQEVNTYYFGTGLQGVFDIGQRSFNWDVNFAAGNNEADQQVHGTYNILHIKRALGPVDQCTGACVPLNIFGGPGSITPEMLNYIQFVEHDASSNELRVWTANLSGNLFDLPAGPLDFAAGFEHRDYQGSYQPGSVVVAGESNGVPSLPTSGGYDVSAGYVELNVPLLSDITAFKSLSLSLASRYADYSTFGGTTNSKIGLRWQVSDDLTLRGTWGEGFRAPSIGELYGSPARFDATMLDPCSAPIADASTAANCAALGVPASYSQTNTQISIRTGGNRKLQPETSEGLTLGAVYSPSWASNVDWADNLNFELGYYSYDIKNAIQAGDAQTRLDRCVASADPSSLYCQGIDRNAIGTITNFDNTLQNLGTVKTAGYDFGIKWLSPQTTIGQFHASWQSTYVSKYEARNGIGALQPRKIGIELNNSAIPRLTSNIDLGWSLDNFRVNYKVRYLSGLREDCAGAAGFAICSNPEEAPAGRSNGTNYLSSTVYNDVRASWEFPGIGLTVNAGINNLFNKAPPVCLSCSLNGYDASTYDLPSRFSYVQLNFKF
ncbi:MAG: TonB-dependent receptor [Xanthomonadales bacterium]|nr:TonB-dependent receptor [Xanthomonadales bacterium]